MPKKDGTVWLCVNFCGLNHIKKKNYYPLPLISESTDHFASATYFTKLDIRETYNRLKITSGDEWMTAFRTWNGHYESTIVFFGQVNAPAAFHGYINTVLCKYLDLFCIASLDGIVVHSNLLRAQ